MATSKASWSGCLVALLVLSVATATSMKAIVPMEAARKKAASGLTPTDYVAALEGSTSCPLGFEPVSSDDCQAGMSVDGVQKTWIVGTSADECRNLDWPSGCFFYGDTLYFSTCTDRALTRGSHYGVCRTSWDAWTLFLSSDLSDSNLGEFSSGTLVGTLAGAYSYDYRIGKTGAQIQTEGMIGIRVATISGRFFQHMTGTFNASGFDNTCTICNCEGNSIGDTFYWHGGRAFCNGSPHFGLKKEADVHSACGVGGTADGQAWGHFHRSNVNSGVYLFGDDCINENEWQERYFFWYKSPDVVSGTGDPHLSNMRGEHFDLYQPGNVALLQLPRFAALARTLLRVEADARRMNDACSVYFQAVSISGTWTNQSEPIQFLANPDGTPEGRDLKKWMRFGPIDLKVVRRTKGVKYLNVYARNVGHSGYEVGGLLGLDDHTAVAKRPRECSHQHAAMLVASVGEVD